MTALPPDINALNRTQPRRRIVAVLARTTTTVVYEVPSGRSLKIESMSMCNTGATTVTVRIHIVVANESASTSNAIYYDTPIRGNVTVLDDSVRHLNSGDRIVLRSDTSSAIALQIHGVEM